MNNSLDLQRALRHLAETLPRDAAPETEQHVLDAFRARKTRRLRTIRYLAASVACLVLASALFLLQHSRHRSHPTATDLTARATSSFIALPYGQSDVPLEQAVIVRVKLQPSEWAAFGAPGAPPRANAISADLLIGQDGVARAVRLVSVQ